MWELATNDTAKYNHLVWRWHVFLLMLISYIGYESKSIYLYSCLGALGKFPSWIHFQYLNGKFSFLYWYMCYLDNSLTLNLNCGILTYICLAFCHPHLPCCPSFPFTRCLIAGLKVDPCLMHIFITRLRMLNQTRGWWVDFFCNDEELKEYCWCPWLWLFW